MCLAGEMKAAFGTVRTLKPRPMTKELRYFLHCFLLLFGFVFLFETISVAQTRTQYASENSLELLIHPPLPLLGLQACTTTPGCGFCHAENPTEQHCNTVFSTSKREVSIADQVFPTSESHLFLVFHLQTQPNWWLQDRCMPFIKSHFTSVCLNCIVFPRCLSQCLMIGRTREQKKKTEVL